MDESKIRRCWDRIPSEKKQEILFRIDEIIEENMIEDGYLRGAKFPVVMDAVIAAGVHEKLFRLVIGLMEQESMIIIGNVMIHKITDIESAWFEIFN
ncbi:MAG TPA: hypothetical protein QF716_03955 [Candidatus Thalassarchaeaceae archaeon]|nr:hypothetical protein [Candidatus Thalassarchaeaceae archaeon]